MAGLRERKKEQTRQRIVAEAAPVFNQRGYAGSSLADLMKATGLEKGGIYRHFSSKEELAGEAATPETVMAAAAISARTARG